MLMNRAEQLMQTFVTDVIAPNRAAWVKQAAIPDHVLWDSVECGLNTVPRLFPVQNNVKTCDADRHLRITVRAALAYLALQDKSSH